MICRLRDFSAPKEALNTFKWHKWFVWYPLIIKDDNTGARVFVFFSSIERQIDAVKGEGLKGFHYTTHYRLI